MHLAHTDTGDLHSWFVQHEPSLLQSIKWTPFTPHATLLKVRSFGRAQGGSGGHGSSPGARVLRILRPPQPVVEPTPTPQQRPEQEQDCVEGEVIIYQGRPHQDNDSSASNDSNDNNASKANASGGERANRGRGRGRGGWQGGAGRGGGGRKRSDHEVLDEGRRFGRQVVESIELLAMQGCEVVDERGRGGYPVYGRILHGRLFFLLLLVSDDHLFASRCPQLRGRPRSIQVFASTTAPVSTPRRHTTTTHGPFEGTYREESRRKEE
jgi:hypothetical protein